jgi:hypothetical protein
MRGSNSLTMAAILAMPTLDIDIRRCVESESTPQSPEEKTRRLNKAEKKRAKRCRRNLTVQSRV